MCDLVEDTGGGVAEPLKTCLIACVSILSLNGVEVPWALM